MDLNAPGHTSAPPQRALRTLDPVNVPPVVQRHPALRWLAPLAVVGIAGIVATGMLRAQATSETLPDATPRALLTAVQQPQLNGFSGTVVSRLSLGLPELPSLGDDAGGSSLASLLTGSHTLKVWYGGPAQQRVALLGATDETDVFRSGRQVWQWTSADRVALHAVLPEGDESGMPAPQNSSSLTPAGLAADLLRHLDPTTKVTVGADQRVANRSAYELVLTPRTSATKVGSVRIAIDGKTKAPLGVQVFARGSRTAAIDIAYTSISFVRPADTSFRFTPPAGATVRTWHAADSRSGGRGEPAGRRDLATRLTTTGAGWSTVWTYRASATGLHLPSGPLTEASTRVYGPWGAGRLFSSDLASVLVTDDGRVLAGAVEANTLFAAAK